MTTDGHPQSQPYFIGLTGNIATGKSTVLAYLAQKGAYVVDADKLAHRAMAPDGPAYEKVMAAFGNSILTETGEIDRVQLGEIVFSDADALAQLEAIVHPATFELLRWELTSSNAEIVVLEAIKLLESGRMLTLCDEVWVVVSHPDEQLQRLVSQRGMSEEAACQRMSAQSHQAEKVAQADEVILNDGSLDDLHARLDALWDATLARARDRNEQWT